MQNTIETPQLQMQFIDTIVHTPVALSFRGTQTSESLGRAPGRHVEFADTLEVVEFKPSLPAEIADHHFERLCAASRHKSLALSNKQRRQFTHLDIDFNWSRQVTANKREQLITFGRLQRLTLRLPRRHQGPSMWRPHLCLRTSRNRLCRTSRSCRFLRCRSWRKSSRSQKSRLTKTPELPSVWEPTFAV